MKRRLLVSCALLALIAACGGDDDDDTTIDAGPDIDAPAQRTSIVISGTVDDALTNPAAAGPSADPPPAVDTVVAIPIAVGPFQAGLLTEMKSADVSTDAAFALELDTGRDWVLLLVDSTKDLEEKVIGYVTVGQGSDSMLLFPVSDATDDIDLGLVTDSGDGDGIAESDLGDIESSFEFTLADLVTIARADGMYQAVANNYLNWNPTTEVYWNPQNELRFRGPIAVIDTATPNDYQYMGVEPAVETNDPAHIADFSAFCSGSNLHVARPPWPVYVMDQATGPHRIIDFRNDHDMVQVDANLCKNDEIRMELIESGSKALYSFPTDGDLLADQVDGFWDFIAFSDYSAKFDLTAASPLRDDDGLDMVLPMPKPVYDGSGVVTDVEVTWWFWNADTLAYEEMTDVAPLDAVFANYKISIGGQTASEGRNFDTAPTSYGAPDGEWYVNTGDFAVDVLEIVMHFESAGSMLTFQWSIGDFCGDDALFSQFEMCDRSQLDSQDCVSLGHGAGTLACNRFCRWELADCTTGIPSDWVATGSMSVERTRFGSALLPDGRVLVLGGNKSSAFELLASAEIYDPTTELFTATDSMAEVRMDPRVTVLQDGRVLVTGGLQDDVISQTAEIFDPATETWSYAANSFTAGGWGHAATLLDDGRVLLTGGNVNPITWTDVAEADLFDPTTDTFSSAGAMTVDRMWHTATQMENGAVLIAGGSGLKSAEIWISDTGFNAIPAEMGAWRMYMNAAALPGNQVLIAGGRGSPWGPSSSMFDDIALTEVFDFASQEFRPVATTMEGAFNTMTAMPGGQFLIIGSHTLFTANPYSYVYYPLTETRDYLRRASGSYNQLGNGRTDHQTVLLEDGRVLVCGGRTYDYTASCELLNAE